MSQIDAVIFDMDGVLCDLDDAARIATLVKSTGHESDFIVKAIWGSGFEDQADEGRYTAAEYLLQFGELLQKPFTQEEWVAYRKSGMTPIGPVLDLAAELSRSLDICVLTNNGYLLEEEIDSLFPELRAIFGKRIWSSASYGCRKPNTEIFLQTCQRMKSDPSRTLLVDDRAENIVGAQDAGLHGHHFTNVDQLKGFLKELGAML